MNSFFEATTGWHALKNWLTCSYQNALFSIFFLKFRFRVQRNCTCTGRNRASIVQLSDVCIFSRFFFQFCFGCARRQRTVDGRVHIKMHYFPVCCFDFVFEYKGIGHAHVGLERQWVGWRVRIFRFPFQFCFGCARRQRTIDRRAHIQMHCFPFFFLGGKRHLKCACRMRWYGTCMHESCRTYDRVMLLHMCDI